MAQYRSGTNYSPALLTSGDIIDASGHPIVSVDVGFGEHPVSRSVVSQIKFGIPNGQFNMLPPDASLPLGGENQLPYWRFDDLCDTAGAIEARVSTTDGGLTYGITIDPNGAILDDEIVLTARVPVLTDTNLNLRQKLVSTLTKSSAYSGTNEWNLVASATYYDHGNNQLDSFAIGTAAHNDSWTQLGGTTTTGGSAISGSAAYVDIAFTLTALTTVTDTTTVTINSVLLADSSPSSAGGAFLVTDTFTSSGSWVRPTGVDYATVVAVGAGGGGGSGGARMTNPTTVNTGGSGGGGARWAILRNLYVGNLGTVTIGVGAGGVGGTAVTRTTTGATVGVAGGAGGATTFNTNLSVPGGSGGGAGGSTALVAGGAAGGTVTVDVYDQASLGGLPGGAAGTANGGNGTSQGTSNASSFRLLPYTPLAVNGTNGGIGEGTGGTQVTGALGTAIALGYGGGGGGGGATRGTALAGNGGNASSNTVGTAIFGTGAGGGGAARAIGGSGAVRVGTAGNGGDAGAATGAGGGGGGAIVSSNPGAGDSYTIVSGKGGNGSGGVVYVIYVA